MKNEQWWVCDLNEYGWPNWQNADGPHDNRDECEETIAILNRLNCIEKKGRVILKVQILKGRESTKNINWEAINRLNSI